MVGTPNQSVPEMAPFNFSGLLHMVSTQRCDIATACGVCQHDGACNGATEHSSGTMVVFTWFKVSSMDWFKGKS